MRFVVSLAFNDPSHLVPLARAAEAAGFDSLALSDHVVHPREIRTPYPYTEDGSPRWPPFTAWPDPWVTIGHLAAVTERLRFLTSVYVLAMRNPFQVAKTVGTAAVLSRNRVALGVGAGWMRDEFELMQQPFEGRGARLDEMLEVLAGLWAGGWVEHHGEHYRFDALEMSPVPSEKIPIYVGGFSAPALRRAATRADGWISDLHTTAVLADLIPKVRALRADSPRAGDPFDVLVSCVDAYDLGGYRRLEDLGVTHVMTMPWIFYGASQESLEQKLAGIARFGDEVLAKLS